MTLEMIVRFTRRAAGIALLVSISTAAAAQKRAPGPRLNGDSVHVADHTSLTPTERKVLEIISGDGIHVIHFWSPRHERSISTLRDGWFEFIETNGDAAFTFVAVWNDGKTGENILEDFVILDRVEVLALPDYGPSDIEKNRRTSFLSLPLTWTPSTWIFHQNGTLAFAMNYGELGMSELQGLIDILRIQRDETTP